MPELPEVETTRRGLLPHVEGQRVSSVLLRRPDLRWPIP
ncbi:MAG: DNA-formamidopyrimidine glycosylase family protein, partial [Thermomonas sp.]